MLAFALAARCAKVAGACCPLLFVGAGSPTLEPGSLVDSRDQRTAARDITSIAPPLAEPLVPEFVPTAVRTLAQRQWLEPGQPLETSWRLSVIDGGQPRGTQGNARPGSRVTNASNSIWPQESFATGSWKFQTLDGKPEQLGANLGTAKCRPICGDFNGDGRVEFALFVDGRWLIDLNGNGTWDNDDLVVQLGQPGDQPIVGDWDGDGKTDIGVFGRARSSDRAALVVESGLPDAGNDSGGRPKNVPVRHSALGQRSMQLTSHGAVRADSVDHVFQFGSDGDLAVSGDWNGDGIDSVGIFRHGRWVLDVDGDGQYGPGDASFDFGPADGLPVAGDFNGDGRDEVGVFAAGRWHLDTNGDHVLDQRDAIIELGSAGDQPIVGDFADTGSDAIGVYRAQ